LEGGALVVADQVAGEVRAMSDSDLTDFIAGIGKPAAGGSEAEDQRQPTIFDELDTLRAERTRRGDNRWSCSPQMLRRLTEERLAEERRAP
jgi:hypothetical protein